MSKTNVTEYSDRELSLLVMNEESLYREATRRSATHESITEMVTELFVYTPAQLADLLETCDEDRAEREAE